jgi:hypothetical protein
MVFVMMSTTLDTVEKADPKASVSVRALSNGYHVVSITSIDQSLDPSKVEWAIVNQSGQSIKEHYGFVDDAEIECDSGNHIFQLVDKGSNTVLAKIKLPTSD